FITVSLDDLADIKTFVPKFLNEMNAEMPAYLLKTADESAAITMVAKDWNGNLPLTVLFTSTGETAYVRKGKIRYESVIAEIDKVLKPVVVSDRQIVDLPTNMTIYSFEKGVTDARRDIELRTYKVIRYGLTPEIPPTQIARLKQKYLVTVSETGCLVPSGYVEYVRGYNETIMSTLQKKYGNEILAELKFAQNL
ncbi:MAG: hypothetical protein ABIP78_10255, partial [Pyrinomonadaceae bacterium]